MATLQPRYDKNEFAGRGQEIFERDVRPKLMPDDDGKFVAIDIETGAYATDTDDFTATEFLLNKKPDAQIWLVRAGQAAAYRIGCGSVRGRAA